MQTVDLSKGFSETVKVNFGTDQIFILPKGKFSVREVVHICLNPATDTETRNVLKSIVKLSDGYFKDKFSDEPKVNVNGKSVGFLSLVNKDCTILV